MPEIRPVRESESEAFLQLLCDAFSLNVHLARDVFYREPFFDLNRKWGLFEGGEMKSILTTVPLEFGWGKGVGIAGVATKINYRSKGLGEMLLRRVIDAGRLSGESHAYLFAANPTVYERAGFTILDEVVQGEVETSTPKEDEAILTCTEVRRIYEAWCSANPNRLRRDERRWRYWEWSLKLCSAHDCGYLCREGANIREAIVTTSPAGPWRSHAPLQWTGMRSLTEVLQVPLVNQVHHTYFLGTYGAPLPQLFVTDQF